MAEAPTYHLEVEGLHKRYGEHHVLRGVELKVARGQVHMVLGGSGTGKSVLMRQIMCLEQPDAGSVRLEGQELIGLDERAMLAVRRRLGMVFQGSALFDSMTVFDNVAFPLHEHSGLSREALEARVMELLEALQVAAARKKMPSEISGGMQKRVAIARALALETEFIIYDEPTTGLDPLTARAVDDLIRETSERFEVTALVVSHDIESVLRVAHRVSYLFEGQALFDGEPTELLAQSHPAIDRYLQAAGVRR